jgi:hypothetical protein
LHVQLKAPDVHITQSQPPATHIDSRRRWLVLIFVWTLSAGYMATHLKRGWVPHDEGAFAESGLRVMNGELPHRDFDELYTGGLSYLHAFAFREMGINLVSMRYVLYVFFLAWILAVFYVASRFLSDFVAGCIALLAVAWSVPNYAAAVPSWYNLFFATFGAAALLRCLEVGSRRWLFLAGIFGGLSILAKIVGVFYVAAALLFLVFREQCLASSAERRQDERSHLYSVSLFASLTLFLFFLFHLVHKIPGVAEFTNFVLPACVLAMLLLEREFAGVQGSSSERFRRLLRFIWPFVAGTAGPILVFMIPYIHSGALRALFEGIFILPTKRLGFAETAAPPLIAMLPIVGIMVVILIAHKSESFGRRIWCGILALGLGAVLVASAKFALVCKLGWYSLAASIPLIVVTTAVVLGFSRQSRGLSPLRQQQLMLLASITALTSLVQFPFSAQVYFCYVAPLAILTGAALMASLSRPPRFVIGALVIFYLCFAVFRVTPTFIYEMGKYYSPDTQTERLSLPLAGGLRVDPREAGLYERLIPLVHEHAAGQFIYAAPDCPEVYFLSGLQNPTRTLFDFLDDATDRTQRILTTLEDHHVRVVAIKQSPGFSNEMDPSLEKALDERFPKSEDLDEFEVRWRE